MTCYTVCTCAVSLQCEPESGSSNEYSDWTTCYTVGNCIAWPQHESFCGKKVLVCLQMSWDTKCKAFVLPSQNTSSRPFWVPKLTDGLTIKRNQTADNSHFLLAPSEYCALYLLRLKKNNKQKSNNWPRPLSQTLKCHQSETKTFSSHMVA